MRGPFRSTNWAGSKMQLPFMPKFASCPRRECSRWEASDMDEARRVEARERASQSNLRIVPPLRWPILAVRREMSPAGTEPLESERHRSLKLAFQITTHRAEASKSSCQQHRSRATI